MPPDSEQTKAFAAQLDAVASEFTKIALADKAKEVAQRLKENLKLYKDDFDGYDQEVAGPTWEQYKKESSQKMSAFYAPKTKEVISRTESFMENLTDNEDYQAVQSADEVKAIVVSVKTKHDAAYAKMLTLVTPVVTAALTTPVGDDESTFGRLSDDVRGALGEKSPEGIKLQEQITKKLEANTAATTGADEAKKQLIVNIQGKANEAWPALSNGISAATDFDISNPGSFKGKTIRFEAPNRMGWSFKPSDFYFATNINGIAVAGVFDPVLASQIKLTEAAIGRSIGDDDSDGDWELIAVVTDRKAKLLARRQIDADFNNGVKVEGEYTEPVDAVIVEIIAGKCGPFAGSKDKGVTRLDGSVGK